MDGLPNLKFLPKRQFVDDVGHIRARGLSGRTVCRHMKVSWNLQKQVIKQANTSDAILKDMNDTLYGF